MPRKPDQASGRLKAWIGFSLNPVLFKAIRDFGLSGLDDAIMHACKAFGLNGEDAADRKFLLGILAAVTYEMVERARPKRRGRPKEYDQRLLTHLLEIAWARTVRQRPSARFLARALKAEFKEEYRHRTEDALAKQINLLGGITRAPKGRGFLIGKKSGVLKGI